MTRPADKIIAITSKIDAILESASAGSLSAGNIGFGTGNRKFQARKRRKEVEEDVLLPPEQAPSESQTGDPSPSERDGSNERLNDAVVVCIKVCYDGCSEDAKAKIVSMVAKKMKVDAGKLKKAWKQFDECDKMGSSKRKSIGERKAGI
jgi:hypothetical protein